MEAFSEVMFKYSHVWSLIQGSSATCFSVELIKWMNLDSFMSVSTWCSKISVAEILSGKLANTELLLLVCSFWLTSWSVEFCSTCCEEKTLKE